MTAPTLITHSLLQPLSDEGGPHGLSFCSAEDENADDDEDYGRGGGIDERVRVFPEEVAPGQTIGQLAPLVTPEGC